MWSNSAFRIPHSAKYSHPMRGNMRTNASAYLGYELWPKSGPSSVPASCRTTRARLVYICVQSKQQSSRVQILRELNKHNNPSGSRRRPSAKGHLSKFLKQSSNRSDILCGHPVGRITRLARPSVRLSRIRARTRKQKKKRRKIKNGINVSQGTNKWSANFQLKNGQGHQT